MNLQQVKDKLQELNNERVEILKHRESLEQQIKAITDKAIANQPRSIFKPSLPPHIERKIVPLQDEILGCNDDLKDISKETSQLEKQQEKLELEALEPRRQALRDELAEKVKDYNAATDKLILKALAINAFIGISNSEVGSMKLNERKTLLSASFDGQVVQTDKIPKLVIERGQCSAHRSSKINDITKQVKSRGGTIII